MALDKFKNLALELSKILPSLTKRKTDFIVMFIFSILKVETVNLVRISASMGAKEHSTSKYRRTNDSEMKLVGNVKPWCQSFSNGLLPLDD